MKPQTPPPPTPSFAETIVGNAMASPPMASPPMASAPMASAGGESTATGTGLGAG